ncbi:Vacuolar protein [Coemansia sp. RSA 552]|nr:Vacuolar protein [Coemansia sp. RSA 552]
MLAPDDTDSASPTAEWHALEDVFYRRHTVYRMQWGTLALGQFRVAVAPFGGPIALARDERQLLEAHSAHTLDTAVHVCSGSGQALRRIEAGDTGARLAGFSWNAREQLVAVQTDGTVRVHTLDSGVPAQVFSLGGDARDHGVADVRFWDQGLVALTNARTLVYVGDTLEPKPRTLAGGAALGANVYGWAAVAPHVTLSRHVEVVAGVGTTIVAVDAAGAEDQLVDGGPFDVVSVSPNGRLVALCAGARMQIVSADFQRSFSEALLGAPVDNVAWCGADAAVAALADGSAVVVGPFGSTLVISEGGIGAGDPAVHLAQEPDGVRIITGSSHAFVSRVTDDARSIFQAGSTAPAALLFDAAGGTSSSPADSALRAIGDAMAGAVDSCISAAGSEPHVPTQQALLRAASLGKAFVAGYSGDRLVDACRDLRAVNALGAMDVGMPVTLLQFRSQPSELWVGRLLHRGRHQLALALSELLDQPPGAVYVHWACAKIRASTLDDDALYRAIAARLHHARVASVVDIAEAAAARGYRRLAVRLLLRHEPRAATQVPLLLAMHHHDAAMRAALRSADADLVYFVIFHLLKAAPLGDFFRRIAREPAAARLFEKYCRQTSAPILEDYYFQEDAHKESARLIIAANLPERERDPARRIANLKIAQKTLARDPSQALESRALDTEIRLAQAQQKLAADLSDPEIIGLPLNATLARCLAAGNYSRASKLRTEFRVPEPRFYLIKIAALVGRRDWVELARLASARKSPVGYRPFADACINALQYQEAARYIARCDTRDQPRLFLRIGFFREAADAAASTKDIDSLRAVHAACSSDANLQHDIAQQIERLTLN